MKSGPDSGQCAFHLQETKDKGSDCEDETGRYFLPPSRRIWRNSDCCVKTILTTVVIFTGIIIVVIISSHGSSDQEEGTDTTKNPSKESPYKKTQGVDGNNLIVEHQFLVAGEHTQIIALVANKPAYVIIWPDFDKFYNLYAVVDFDRNTETFLGVAKSHNSFATDIEEQFVLFCRASTFHRDFRGNFASLSDFMAISGVQMTANRSLGTLTYIGAPLILERFISSVIHSSCEGLAQDDVFTWNQADESLACGARLYSQISFSCTHNYCQDFLGSPQSKGQICHKFRGCNYVQRSCQPTDHTPVQPDQPYCVCRRTAARDAQELTCPRVADDGGECELPRRDLLVLQSNSACLCLYQFPVLYPYLPRNNGDHSQGQLLWHTRVERVMGPALRFSHCLC